MEALWTGVVYVWEDAQDSEGKQLVQNLRSARIEYLWFSQFLCFWRKYAHRCIRKIRDAEEHHKWCKEGRTVLKCVLKAFRLLSHKIYLQGSQDFEAIHQVIRPYCEMHS